ncbi:unnamed protein product [Hermetia illucens]|uniref:Uncharacterized protein n=1 Tax=Hermetia illucens TaxID=343691 RepID=A0A7R8UBE9_HERIL|nr:uncharacterized protein LOC119659265 [Hermetia illucens]CAD7077654.1 unnamed protein product [Hermetia illucens]
MDLKIVFIVVVAIVSAYRMEVNNDDDDFAVILCKKFNFSRDVLFKFTTMPHMIDKWIEWIPTFMDADHKPLGTGKTFKALYHDAAATTLLKVTDFDEGNYVAVESNFVFSPRIELYFFDKDLKGMFHWDVVNGSNESGCHNHISHHQRLGSELGVRLTIKSKSALFQYTLGISIRAFLRQETRRLLSNLEAVIQRYLWWHNHFRTEIRGR